MSVRKRLYDHEAIYLGKELNPKEENRKHALYRIKEKEWEEIKRMRATPNERKFVETIRKMDKDGELLSTVEKLQSDPIEVPDNFELVKISTSKTTGQQWLQYLPKDQVEAKKEINFDSIIAKYIKPIKVDSEIRNSPFLFDRLVYTDVHIGMETNSNGYSLYGGKWDEEELEIRLSKLVAHVLEHRQGNTLIIDELGDFMDGWDGETVRKGHHLPQNMDNEKAFDVGLSFKVAMIDALIPYYEKIICHNICNDNHAGSFGYVVNSAFKKFIEYRYNKVEVINYRRFIEHYTYYNNTFILTHGKDGKHLKFGFKPILDSKQIEKIKNYIDEHCLLVKGQKLEFSKGDSHQKIFDDATSDSFVYYNYGAFSPSSEWVQTNFKKGKSGFDFFNFREDGSKSLHPYNFEWIS